MQVAWFRCIFLSVSIALFPFFSNAAFDCPGTTPSHPSQEVDALWGALCFVAVCAWRLTLATESTSEATALTVDEGDDGWETKPGF